MSPLTAHQAQRDRRLPASPVPTNGNRDLVVLVHGVSPDPRAGANRAVGKRIASSRSETEDVHRLPPTASRLPSHTARSRKGGCRTTVARTELRGEKNLYGDPTMFASARESSPDETALICAKHRARELDGREGRDEERRSNEKAGIKSNGQRSRRVQQPNRRCVTKGHNQAKSPHLRTCVPAKPRPPGLIFTKHEDPRRTRYKGGRIIENGKASGARRGVACNSLLQKGSGAG